jgi:hypothetical protein
MAIHILQIGKQRFICGLFWQSLSRPRELWKEAAELARKIDADLVVIRKDQTMAQAGYAHTRDAARRGMFSLAAIISKTLAVEGVHYEGQRQPVHNWLCALRLPDDKWMYCAVRDANFLPNGDFAGTKEQVLERLYNDYGMGGWNVVLGDREIESVGFHNFCAKRLEDFLPRRKRGELHVRRWCALRQVDSNAKWMPIAIGGMTLALIGTGAHQYWWRYMQAQQEEERAEAFEAARKKLAAVAAPIAWDTKPLPKSTIDACMNGLTQFSPGGWELEEYLCTNELITHRWSRGGSVTAYLLEEIPDAQIEADGSRASHSKSIKLAAGGNEPLPELRASQIELMSSLQLLGLSGNIALRPNPQPPPGGQEQALVPEWKALGFSLNTGSLAPAELVELFSKPGYRLEKIRYQAGAWTIEGVLYAK